MTSGTTERLEAFSDGVIAIAITLLVLQIAVPDVDSGNSLFAALWDDWPSFVAYTVSFVVIGIMWVSHHSMFERIAAVDRTLLFINLVLLLGIAFLPFPTALLATYVREGGTNASAAAAVYSLTMTIIGFIFTAMWVHLYRHPDLLVAGITPDRLRRSIRRSLVGPLIYAASIGLAYVSAVACFLVYALVALYFARGPSSRVLVSEAAAPASEPAPESEARRSPLDSPPEGQHTAETDT
jgi:uncharacterized membrane protein